MLSRWTNIFTEDGEKEWRNRDAEFELQYKSKQALLESWDKAWLLLFNTLNNITPEDYNKLIYIRNQGHPYQKLLTVNCVIYAYHIGQIVYVARMIKGSEWQSFSVPKNTSESYNKEKFSKPKEKGHFTDDLL